MKIDYKIIDLFAGCGGLSLGMENAGFTPIFVNELNSDAMGSYLRNRTHKLGGEYFSKIKSFHSDDINELSSVKLNHLQSEFINIPEIDYVFEDKKSKFGGGSNIDLIAGGPPCQGYSNIGHRRSYSVDKSEIKSNKLYLKMTNVIRALRPRIFLFENVRGLLTSKWITKSKLDLFGMPCLSPIWPEVLQSFNRIPFYSVKWSLVYSRDYGVPQRRPRLFVVGIRNDIIQNCSFIEPNKSEDAVASGFLPQPINRKPSDLVDLLGDLIDPDIGKILRTKNYPAGPLETKKYPKRASTEIQKELRVKKTGIKHCQEKLTEQVYSKHRPHIIEKFEYMLKNRGNTKKEMQTKKFKQKLLPKRWGSAKASITVTSLPDDYVHFSQPRILTVREWARIQTFPDWYQFSGKRTTGGLRRAGNPREGIHDRELPKYTQIGNAVPVKLAENIGLHFKKIIDSYQ